MSILEQWINPYYLRESTIKRVSEEILAKPHSKYICLDDFFLENKLEELILEHNKYSFSEEQDRRCQFTGAWLPYDSAMLSAKAGEHLASELLYHKDWQALLCQYSSIDYSSVKKTEIKLRYHRPHSDGFWIHTDSALRKMVAICYFNKEWTRDDGGLLQLWKIEESRSPGAFRVLTCPEGRLDFLSENTRIRTKILSGSSRQFEEPTDLLLIDQILPSYNKLFLANFLLDETFHSVTPSGNRARTGFVQWLI